MPSVCSDVQLGTWHWHWGWWLEPLSIGSGRVEQTSSLFLFVASRVCLLSWAWATKPDKLVAPTALRPRSFRNGKVGHIGRLGKGTLSVGRK